jgi:hypothetical protein
MHVRKPRSPGFGTDGSGTMGLWGPGKEGTRASARSLLRYGAGGVLA